VSENIDRIRDLLDKANKSRTNCVAIGHLILAVETLCEELQAHQHTYFGPPGLHGKWATTSPQRDTGAAAHAVYLKQQADKKKATS